LKSHDRWDKERSSAEEGGRVTAQVPDLVRYAGDEWVLAGVRGEGLFDPARHGLHPVPISTGCGRGFVCTYALEKERLLLARLEISVREPPPVLLGCVPAVRRGGPTTYAELREPVRFTGGLLLAREFIEDLYVHMGFQPAWKYREVREALCNEGHVVEVADRSIGAASLRETLGRGAREAWGNVGSWMARGFSREY
jgi:hypothetical protein